MVNRRKNVNREKTQWIKKATLVCFLSELLAVVLPQTAIYSEEYNIDFVSSLYGGDWPSYYVGTSQSGPYFIDENTVVFLDYESTNLITINIDHNSVKKVDLGSSDTKLYKFEGEIIVRIDDEFYSFDGVVLKPIHRDIPLKDGFSYDFKMGLYETDSEKRRRIIIPGLGIISARALLNIPVLSKSQNSVYFTLREDRCCGSLYRYSLEDNELELIRKRVRYFSFISEDRLLVYTKLSGKHKLLPLLFHGDFVIIDTDNNSEFYNSDKVFYEKGYESIIGDFDYNGNGKIVALGGFHKVRNGKIVESNEMIILLKIDKK